MPPRIYALSRTRAGAVSEIGAARFSHGELIPFPIYYIPFANLVRYSEFIILAIVVIITQIFLSVKSVFSKDCQLFVF
jgi:hypothetical protein